MQLQSTKETFDQAIWGKTMNSGKQTSKVIFGFFLKKKNTFFINYLAVPGTVVGVGVWLKQKLSL